MALTPATVGGKVAAAIVNGIETVVNLSPTSLIVPTLPTFTGTSGTMSTNGLITFNACTVISVDAAFPTTFRRHLINLQTLNNTGTASMVLRTTAPADDTNLKYDYTQGLFRNSVAASATAPSNANWPIVQLATALLEVKIELNGAAIAAPTTGFITQGVHANPAVSNVNNALSVDYLTQQESVAFGGFKITFSVACSGTLRLIGEY